MISDRLPSLYHSRPFLSTSRFHKKISLVSKLPGGAENAGVENAGVENAGAITYGKPKFEERKNV